MKKNEKTINGYLIADITLLLSIILFFVILYNKNKIAIISFIISSEIFIIFFIFQLLKGKAQVINKSTKTIAVKDEKTENVENIAPNEVSIDIDGINVDGKIYKIPDGVHAKVTKNNKVKINSLIGTIIYCTMGGLLKTPPDEKWNNLFNK